MKINELWIEFHWSFFPKGPIDIKSSLVQVMACHLLSTWSNGVLIYMFSLENVYGSFDVCIDKSQTNCWTNSWVAGDFRWHGAQRIHCNAF